MLEIAGGIVLAALFLFGVLPIIFIGIMSLLIGVDAVESVLMGRGVERTDDFHQKIYSWRQEG